MYLQAAGYGFVFAGLQVGGIVALMEHGPADGWGWFKFAVLVFGAFCLGVFTFMRDPKAAWTVPPAVKLAVVLGLGVALAGCANTQSLDVMKQENARGCVYFRGSAAPWASVNTLIVGTWGQDPPAYEACWRGIPPGL